jgi:hypothetical protein
MSSATYAITVRGNLCEATLSALPELRGEVREDEAVLTGDLRDRSEFYGMVARLSALGLELVDIHRVEQTSSLEPPR